MTCPIQSWKLFVLHDRMYEEADLNSCSDGAYSDDSLEEVAGEREGGG